VVPWLPLWLRRSQSAATIRACAALAKRHTALGNEWLGKRLAMGRSACVSHLVKRMGKSPKDIRTLRKYESLLLGDKDRPRSLWNA